MKLIQLVRETLNNFQPFGLSLSKPLVLQEMPFDKLRANGINQSFLNEGESLILFIHADNRIFVSASTSIPADGA
ncbi:MAG: hypothetical protein LBS89_07915 [Zoogloeaceae bacterium]|jgi:hypothetical protein|nr:hypothetical protein [Zoogloeaceae bacterium]